MRVLHRQEFKIFLPIRPLFFQGRIAETGFRPSGDAGGVDPRRVHVVLVLVAGDRTFAECGAVDCLKQRLFMSWFDAGFNEVAHAQTKSNATVPACHPLAFILLILIVLVILPARLHREIRMMINNMSMNRQFRAFAPRCEI